MQAAYCGSQQEEHNTCHLVGAGSKNYAPHHLLQGFQLLNGLL